MPGGLTAVWQIADALGLADTTSVQKTGAAQLDLGDLLGLTDFAAPVLTGGAVNWTHSVADVFGLSDALGFQRQLGLVIADALGLTDATMRQREIARLLVDTLGLTDAATVLYRGDWTVLNDAGAIYLGDVPAVAVYLGSVKVWPML